MTFVVSTPKRIRINGKAKLEKLARDYAERYRRKINDKKRGKTKTQLS